MGAEGMCERGEGSEDVLPLLLLWVVTSEEEEEDCFLLLEEEDEDEDEEEDEDFSVGNRSVDRNQGFKRKGKEGKREPLERLDFETWFI